MSQAAKIDNSVLENPHVIIGKDVLELLSSSMYINPLSIFREYIQNATDAIDAAVEARLIQSESDGRIEVNLDHIDRRVVIRDNGIGLSNNDFPSRMVSFGASAKRGTDARGFRGVGRLAALGYAQKLIFRSRSKSDSSVFEAVWNGRAAKQLLSSAATDTNLTEIVNEVVQLNRCEPEGYPDHFFEVELVKPRRIANDRLLNEVEIGHYLSQICPCPFSPEFSFVEEITKLLSPHGRAGKTYNIFINDAEVPVYRPYRNNVFYSESKSASLQELKTFEIEGVDGGTAAIGWLIHHDYQGAIPVGQGVRGLRGRVGNIQVGHDRLFASIFPEDRFSSWCIGEVHILDARVIPNGRRDEFESNAHFDNILAHLRPIGADVARHCRLSSQKRARLKTFELNADKIYERLDILQQGAVSQAYAKTLKAEMGSLLSEMNKVVGFELFEDGESAALRGRLHNIEKDMDAVSTKMVGDLFEHLPVRKHSTYKEVFDLIYDCSANQVAAKSLIDRILDRLSRS